MVKSTMIYPEIGQKIKAARERRGITQTGLGERFTPPVVKQTIIRWEKGDKSLNDIPKLKALEDILGFAPGELRAMLNESAGGEYKIFEDVDTELLAQCGEKVEEIVRRNGLKPEYKQMLDWTIKVYNICKQSRDHPTAALAFSVIEQMRA